jgi:rhamnogalacturonyl hydrolase YesR
VRKAILDHGRKTRWQLGPRIDHADDQLIGSTYVWAASNGAGAGALQHLRSRLDQILANPPRAHLAMVLGLDETRGHSEAEALKRWSWSDALFMAPATWLRLSRVTGDRRYRDYALREFWASNDFLYDPAERLYFRDSRFFDKRDEKGRKIFWSRGNGWVIAGLAQMIEALPVGDVERRRLEDQFREFAGRVVELQKPDGYWPSSLLASEDSMPESSGTALFTYGLAWGIGQGLLPRAEYEPAVRRGWQALNAALQPDGRLGWVQAAGDRPAPATANGTQIYATGAYLLAASAIADLERKR